VRNEKRENERRDEVECLFTGDVWFLPFSSMEPVALVLHLCSATILQKNIFVLLLYCHSCTCSLDEIGAICYMVRRPSFILVSVMIGHK
jgi:hypothetical protein